MASLCSSVQGTTSTVGRGILILGNNTASGTAGNAKGRIYLYGEGTSWAAIDTAVNGTANRFYTIPDAGASADFVMTAGDQTIDGTKTHSGSIKFSGYSNGIIDNSANAKFNTLHIYKNISGDYTTIVNTTASVQQNSIFNAKPTAAGVTNQIVFVI